MKISKTGKTYFDLSKKLPSAMDTDHPSLPRYGKVKRVENF